ncbi:unknown [Alistipes sp. CAG:157]|nr:unknown [Alistipes sp. CAG:157]
MAVRVDIVTMMETIQPSSRNMIPDMPDTSVSGRNTATTVSVVTMTDSHTSLVPYMAASLAEEPFSMWVVIFSSTTMASSTTIPMAMESELSEMMLMVPPVR